MFSLVIATMLSVSSGPAMPVIVAGYTTLGKCRAELVVVAKELDYKLVTSPFLGYIAQKETEEKTTLAFCARNIESV